MLKTKYQSCDKKAVVPSKSIVNNFKKLRSVSNNVKQITLSKTKPLSAFCTKDSLMNYVTCKPTYMIVPHSILQSLMKPSLRNSLKLPERLSAYKNDKGADFKKLNNNRKANAISLQECKLFVKKRNRDKQTKENFEIEPSQCSTTQEHRRTMQKIYSVSKVIKPFFREEVATLVDTIKNSDRNNDADYRKTRDNFGIRKRKIVSAQKTKIDNAQFRQNDVKSPVLRIDVPIPSKGIDFNPFQHNHLIRGYSNPYCCSSGNCSSKSLHKIVMELNLNKLI